MVDPFSHIHQLFHHIDFGFTSCCFPGFTAMMLGYQASDSENAAMIFFLGFFFKIRPTDPISGNALEGKRKKKWYGLYLFQNLYKAVLLQKQ